MKALLATTLLLTTALAFAGSAQAWVKPGARGPGHECGGDLDHECTQCPTDYAYDNGRCIDRWGNVSPGETCAIRVGDVCV